MEQQPNFILDVLSYPFRKGGRNILIVGAILLILSQFGSIFPAVGLFVTLFVFAYLCGLYFELVLLSTDDEGAIYSFPDLNDPLDDILLPTLKVLGVILISFAPLFAWLLWGDESAAYADGVTYGLVAWGIFYFPMAMLATVIVGTSTAGLPHIVLPSIVRSGPLYLLAAALVVGIYLLGASAHQFLSEWPLLTIPITSLLSMYVLMANARTLGLLFQRKEKDLNWFYSREEQTRDDPIKNESAEQG